MPKRRRVSEGAIALRGWLATERRSQAWLAAECGVVQAAVSAWLLGSSPRIEHAVTIEALTAIPVTAWARRARPVAS